MPEYRRSFVPGGTFFFTVVTFQRQPLLITEKAREILRQAWLDVEQRFPFTTDAICLLPDHIHCVWTLPEGDANFSVRWKEIKRVFSKEYSRNVGCTQLKNTSREKRQEVTVWQRRFLEHVIRDEDDLNRHFNYIHYNPVKHGLVKSVRDWQWSSFHRFVKMGIYEEDWGADNERDDFALFGE